MSSNEEWEVQTTIMHGPQRNDRGDRLFMTNLRGFTVRAVQDHFEDFADRYGDFVKASQKIHAADAIFEKFPDTERVREGKAQSSSGRGRSALADRDGELCEAHELPMRYKSGKSKAGNQYELLECTAKRNPCDAIWPDRD